jgi:hypothetical protein
MGLQYENRRGQTYHLQQGKTPTGKPKYYMGRKLTGTPLDALPDGLEIYESPERGQVFVRKVKTSAITALEKEMTTDAIRRSSGIEHVIVDVEEDSLVVYVPSMDISEAEQLIHALAGAVSSTRARELRQSLLKRSPYEKMLRFVLVNAEHRAFAVQRWCFRGSIDDWIYLGGPAPLAELVGKYSKHLGKESFFDLL